MIKKRTDSAWGDVVDFWKCTAETCRVCLSILTESCTGELVFTELSRVSKWLKRFYNKRWLSLKSIICGPGSHDFVRFFLSDDDLGKSDSSSGSMDSFQVGPALSARCSHIHYIITQSWSTKPLFLTEAVSSKTASFPQTFGLNLGFKVTGYTPNFSGIHLLLQLRSEMEHRPVVVQLTTIKMHFYNMTFFIQFNFGFHPKNQPSKLNIWLLNIHPTTSKEK